MSFFESILLAGLLGCCSGTQANDPAIPNGAARAVMLPLTGGVKVTQLQGTVEYAYDGTGWRSLALGKRLLAGATVRASAGSTAVLKIEERGSFVRICASAALHLTTQTPADEHPLALAAVR